MIERVIFNTNLENQHIKAKIKSTLVGDLRFNINLPIVEIKGIGVKDEHQGKGIGSKLVQIVEGLAIKLKATSVTTVTDENSRVFFEKRGYEKNGTEHVKQI